VVARESRKPHGARRLVAVGAVAVGAVLALSGCSVDDAFAFGWPQGITNKSHSMRGMWVGSTIAALVVGVIVWSLILWCVVRYRKRAGDVELPPQTRYNLPIELIYTVLPFLIIAVLFYKTAIVETSVDTITKPDVTVSVVAFKWNWQFSYPDTVDAQNQPVTTTGDSDYIPVLVVPTDERVLFTLNAKDVIHSFWVPDMLFKRDVFPGPVTNSFEVIIEKEGAYVGRCAELCGTYHSQMNFEMRAVTPAKFQQYLDYRKQGLSTPDALSRIGENPYATTTFPFDTGRGQKDDNR
jgi:cytochrome c oxidase subunit II